MLTLGYRSRDHRAVIRWNERDEAEPWLDIVRRLILDNSDAHLQEDGYTLSLPWWEFVPLRQQLLQMFRGFGLSLHSNLEVTAEAAGLLRRASENVRSYANALESSDLAIEDVLARLEGVGFARALTAEQLRNVRTIGGLPAAATFSVPGAGKTTEALASFFLRARVGERLLVIAPKNAFAAWDEQLSECLPSLDDQFVRLRGGVDKISRALEDKPRFMLITYQQLVRVTDLLAREVANSKVWIFLDESHRIKGGVERQTARAVLSFSHLAVGKLIMSGTPMPQSPDDLVPQFTFLYPEVRVDAASVVERIRPVYVRTTKRELRIPEITRRVRPLDMPPVQRELYSLMHLEVARQAARALDKRTKGVLRSLGRSVARLLQFVSNPTLLSHQIAFAHPDLLRAVLTEGDGPKVSYVLQRTRQLVSEGKKVLIWSSFVRNVEYLADRLADVGAVYIHGGVDAGGEDDDESREGKIRLFHDDPNVNVLVANPAAASEGISLHRVCHHAIYLDRTFNAAHYLQSEDRIHRLGLPENQETVIEIVECTGSIDETVRERLGFKIRAMGEALDDPDLRVDPIPLDPLRIDDFEDYAIGLSESDVEALVGTAPEG